MFNFKLKSESVFTGKSSSYILLSDLEKNNFSFFVGSTPLDPSLTQSLEDSQAFIDLFPDSPTLKAVNIITSKLLQMESNGNQLLKKNGCRVCGNYKAGQMWLRWQNDQLLVSPYSASLLLIKPVMRIAAIINWETSSCQQILRTVMSREMKDSEGELKMVKIGSLLKYI